MITVNTKRAAQIPFRFDLWERFNASAMPYAAIGLSTLLICLCHDLLGFNSGLEALYVIPVWLSIRLLGGRKSVGIIVAVGLVMTLARPHPSVPIGSFLSAFGLRLLGLSLVACLIYGFENSFKKLKGLAYQDPLTGLLNRHGLKEFGQRILGFRSVRATVVVIDCDGFKQVNDKYGHAAGDHILKMLARILEHETRSSDALVRMGGDEFALVLQAASIQAAQIVLERVQSLFEHSVSDAGYDCSISFGIAEPDAEDELEEVLAKADAAMYDQKNFKKSSRYVL
jgi:diguanylate cyclase (GGDEF)-like protein